MGYTCTPTNQDVSLSGVSVRVKRVGYAGTFLGERSVPVTLDFVTGSVLYPPPRPSDRNATR